MKQKNRLKYFSEVSKQQNLTLIKNDLTNLNLFLEVERCAVGTPMADVEFWKFT